MIKFLVIGLMSILFYSTSCGKDYEEYIDEKENTEDVNRKSVEDNDTAEDDNNVDDNIESDEMEETGNNNEEENNANDTDISNDSTKVDNTNDVEFPDNGDKNNEEETKQDEDNTNKENEDDTFDKYDDSNIDEETYSHYHIEKYMDLECQSGLSAQGSACYGNYFFQGYAGNKFITVYDLSNKNCIGSFDTTGPYNKRIHANTLNFGNQRYEPSDEFPMLYVNSGYTINGNSLIYVYRVIKSKSGTSDIFNFKLIQTITLKGFGTWTEGILDNENGYLWIKYEKSGNVGPYGYAKFDIPDINDGNVVIDYNNNIEDFSLQPEPFPSSNQGHLFQNDKILLVSGVPSKHEKLAFISINTITHERELIIDLAEAGLVNKSRTSDNAFEPEGCIIYNGNFMICYYNFIYTISIE